MCVYIYIFFSEFSYRSASLLVFNNFSCLAKTSERSNKTTAIAMPWLGKHVPAAKVTPAMWETGSFLHSPHWGVIKKIIGVTSSVDIWQAVLYWKIEGRTWAWKAEEFLLFTSVTRKGLLKTLEAGEELAYKCEVWRLAVAL